MGALTVNLPQSLMDKLDRIANTTDLPAKMIKAGMDVMEPEVKRRLATHKESGALIESVKESKPRMDSKGNWRGAIYFDGYDEKGIPNDRKMMSMEWGTSKQVANPVIRPTKESKQAEADAAMQAVFDKEVK